MNETLIVMTIHRTPARRLPFSDALRVLCRGGFERNDCFVYFTHIWVSNRDVQSTPLCHSRPDRESRQKKLRVRPFS